jgi:cysteine desulfurase / selenocysteine lyase
MVLEGLHVKRETLRMVPSTSIGFDLSGLRHETPGCEERLHFNNAGAALMPEPVLDAMIGYLQLEAAIGGYEAADQESPRIRRVYDEAAALIGARPEEIALVDNATRGWQAAFWALPFEPGDRILTGRAEYISNYLAFLQLAKRRGVRIDVIPDDSDGQISVDALAAAIDKRVRLIALTHVPTNGGLVNPAAAVGSIACEAGVVFLLDACQSVGQLPLDVTQLGCDILAATGRKYLRGPRGTGFLFVRHDLADRLEPAMVDVRGARWLDRDRYELAADARRFETWEMNYAAIIGLGEAIAYARRLKVDVTWLYIRDLARRLRAGLSEVPDLSLHDKGKECCGIVTFSIANRAAEEVTSVLSRQKINTSVSLAEDTLLDTSSRRLGNVVRASVHYYNTVEEVDRFVQSTNQIATTRLN